MSEYTEAEEDIIINDFLLPCYGTHSVEEMYCASGSGGSAAAPASTVTGSSNVYQEGHGLINANALDPHAQFS